MQTNYPPYSAATTTTDREVLALRASRGKEKNILKTRARIEELQEALRERREEGEALY